MLNLIKKISNHNIWMVLFSLLLMPAQSQAVDCEACFTAMEAKIRQQDKVLYHTSCTAFISYKVETTFVGRFCGPTAKTDAIAAVGGLGSWTFYSACGIGGTTGYALKKVQDITIDLGPCQGDADGIPRYSMRSVKYLAAVAGTNCTGCDVPPEEKCYAVTAAASCSMQSIEKNIIGFELTQCDCDTGEMSGGGMTCGDTELYDTIAGDPSGASGVMVLYPNAGCTLTEEEADTLCNSLGSSATCTLDDPDTDGDGVPDSEDFCETPPAEINNVDDIGCTKQGGGDDDGDGVPNEFDKCTTPPGATNIDAFGCQVAPEPGLDTDGDGVEDDFDSCPGTAGNGVDGCEVEGDTKDSDGDGIPDGEDPDIVGDGDSDGPLLRAIIDWLQKVNSGVRDINGNVEGLGGKLDGLGTKIDGLENSVNQLGNKLDGIGSGIEDLNAKIDDFTDTSGVDTQTPDNTTEYNSDLPEEFEPAITYDDLDQSDPSLIGGVWDDLTSATSPITNIINGAGLSASGACSIDASVNVFGSYKSIHFSICDYDLSAWRAIMLGVSALSCFLIVVRRN